MAGAYKHSLSKAISRKGDGKSLALCILASSVLIQPFCAIGVHAADQSRSAANNAKIAQSSPVNSSTSSTSPSDKTSKQSANQPAGATSQGASSAATSSGANSGGAALGASSGGASASTTAGANSSASSSTSPASDAEVDSSVKLAEPIKLSDGAVNHDANKTLDLNPLYLSTAVEMHSFRALRSEASFDQSIKLRDAINYVLDHGMQIKLSRESLIYQHWASMAQYASALPNFVLQYNMTDSNVYNQATTSIGRQFFTGLNFPVFTGGGTMAAILAQNYREKAWLNTYRSTFQDVFLAVYQQYTNLLLQRVLLQISAKAVEADQEQLRINNAQLKNGIGTRFAVLQSEAQLSTDRQAFLNQEVAMRQAALTLNATMNYPMEVNLIPIEDTLTEAPIFNDKVDLKDLMQDALSHSPGLRQYEYFRLVAARNIQTVAANFYPTVAFFVAWQFNDTGVSPPQNGAALGGAATSAITSFLNSGFAGRVSNNALGQQQGFSPTSGTTSTQGANTAPLALPSSSGGVPIYAVQSGSAVSSGAVAPSIFGGGNGTSSGPNQNGSLQAPAGVFPGLFREIQMGFQFNWSVPSAGLGYTAALYQARNISRQAMLQCNQELTLVEENVRTDYLNMMSARAVIDKAAASVASSREALRIARVRLQGGVGTNLDVIAAQKDYITNLTAQAQAIVASNVSQAQLLHDIGMINATTLTVGYHPHVYDEPRPTKKIHWIYP